MIEIQNPGSALGEAIGAAMEQALNEFLTRLVAKQGCHYLSKSPNLGKSGNARKLLMFDKFGTAYNIDAVIANSSMQPLILIESKYIRYKKHNRDKGSWICTAHPALRRRYASIRSSIAVLAGNWSSSSIAMMKSFDINIFLVPFGRICNLLAKYDIKYDWDEKDRVAAQDAWQKYSHLSAAQKLGIGAEMIRAIKPEVKELVLNILDESVPREISRVTIELRSNLGEAKVYDFANVPQAVEFLNSEELKHVFIVSDALSLYDPPPEFGDDE